MIKSQEGEWKQLEIFYRHWVSSLNLYFVYLICFEEKTVMRALANESFRNVGSVRSFEVISLMYSVVVKKC